MFAHLLTSAIVFAMQSVVAQQANVSFGKAQVEEIICDRPGMGAIINREPALRALLESCFAGELTGLRVYWDCREPLGGVAAGHLQPYRDYPALVRVSDFSTSSAVDKCMMLVIELQHGRFDKNRAALNQMAIGKQISRNDFVRSCVRLEFQAANNAQGFFHNHRIAEANYESDPYYASVMESSGDFSEYLRWQEGVDNKKDNLLQYYGQCYDELMSNRKVGAQ